MAECFGPGQTINREIREICERQGTIPLTIIAYLAVGPTRKRFRAGQNRKLEPKLKLRGLLRLKLPSEDEPEIIRRKFGDDILPIGFPLLFILKILSIETLKFND